MSGSNGYEAERAAFLLSAEGWEPMPDDARFRCMFCEWRGPHADLDDDGDCPECGRGVEPL